MIALAVLSSGCRRRETYPLQAVALTGTTVADNAVLGLDPAQIRGLFEDALTSGGRFTLPPPEGSRPSPEAARVALELGFTRFVQRDESTRTAAEVGARVFLWREGPDGEEEYEVSGAAEVMVAGESAAARQSAMQQALREALANAVLGMHLQRVAIDKRDPALVEALASPDPRVKDAAIRVLADRRNLAVTPSLVERLQSEDPGTVRRTMGQLVELRDPRAVEPLIALTRGKDPGLLREVLYALGALGGADAEAYLYTVAQGHDQSAVRKAATEALEELQAKAEGRRQAPAVSAQNGEDKR